ncbi:hypothetical protein V1507DRAFT_459046 [Lipomyces tetrasporus]
MLTTLPRRYLSHLSRVALCSELVWSAVIHSRTQNRVAIEAKLFSQSSSQQTSVVRLTFVGLYENLVSYRVILL